MNSRGKQCVGFTKANKDLYRFSDCFEVLTTEDSTQKIVYYCHYVKTKINSSSLMFLITSI